ncbi:SDR family NAD(P)-dependent oxidoreductase [Oceanomicrobium pacificus]|uniref:SDR family oxidoreductase n=1 Tax=Oceanomicrobium pacificus TaxID=2692916 RepID=A0A6B0TXM5_9RHOB|nr:SDR family NAD(P)-dependent oxidoreductase [Oceanomicrobium pacificus]MXU66042.1 SDR family oxidoreductase [Oceanomicrobium pacificus]
MIARTPDGWTIISGAAAGIGAALAADCTARGQRVLGIDRDAAELARTAEALGPQFQGAVADMQDADAVRAAIGSVDGPVATLISNAAIVRACPFADSSPDDWAEVIGVNLMGMVHLVQAALPRLSDGGRIVALSSHSAVRGSFGRAAYAASKGGVDALVRVLAVELAPRRITVNAVAPGPVETPHVKASHSDARRTGWAERLPVGRYAAPEEITAAVRFLASPEASYITGQVLPVDGGFTSAGLTHTI